MNRKERLVIACILSIVVVVVGFDLVSDSKEGLIVWHIFAEGSIALVSLFGVFYILRDTALVKIQLEKKPHAPNPWPFIRKQDCLDDPSLRLSFWKIF